MVPALTEGGRSFKGAAAYYLHDKREDGEADRRTTDRVAWTRTLNLPTDDPNRAWRMMVHTAQSQAELKAAAGEKATGRKLTKPVFAYSLAWHPDERPTNEEQIEAARESLKVLGLEKHQALIVCHTDEPHEHVHILVNRVDPATGKAATLSNSKLKLSEWAQEYEQKRGRVYCEKRVENNARRKNGEFVHEPRKKRSAYELDRATGNDDLGAEFTKNDQKQKDAHLNAQTRVMRESHTRQWDELKRTYATMKDRIKGNTRQLKDKKAVEIKTQAKGRWRDLFRKQREHRATFDAAERGTLSKLWSMTFAYRELRQHHPQADALTIFYTLLSSSQRRAMLDAAHERERKTLAHAIGQEIGKAAKVIDGEARRDYIKLRDQFLGQCVQLRQTQATQKADNNAAWQTRNVERKAAFAPTIERAAKQEQRRGRSIKDDDRHAPPRRRDPWPGPS
jgi:hypothetical protein